MATWRGGRRAVPAALALLLTGLIWVETAWAAGGSPVPAPAGAVDRRESDAPLRVYAGENRIQPDLLRQVDALVEAYLAFYAYINVGLIRDGAVVLTRSYGRNRLDSREVYASVAKPVTAVIALSLLEEGLIRSLDDPIAQYADRYARSLPEQYADTPITFRHLLTHRSGIVHLSRKWKRGKLDLLFRPGTDTSYSTKGYTVLGDVLTETTGKTFNRLVKHYIGEPVEAASFRADPVFLDSPGGRVYSTIRDMALFAAGVMEGRYVSTDLLLEEAFQEYGEDRFGAIGMGWYCDNVGTPDLLAYHAGSNGRPRAYIILEPIQKTGVVLTGRNRSSSRDYYFRELAPRLLEMLRRR